MANISYETLIKCPFYLKLNETAVMCEGPKSGTCMITKFPDAAAKKRHMKQNCYHENGGRCFLAAALFQKYDAPPPEMK